MSTLITPSRPLTTRSELPHHVGIINDYVRVPYANGSSFASQFLYREFTRRGHQVTVLGPRDPASTPAELPRHSVQFNALALRNHPGVYLAVPSRQGLAEAVKAKLDVVVAQSGSGLIDFGLWLRAKAGVPFLCVNTIHLPSVYNVLFPDALNAQPGVQRLFDSTLIPKVERMTARAYNETDGLIVLSEGLRDYWRERGVTVPIHVIPRPVDPGVFERPMAGDPFPENFERGARLLCVCRHTREKDVDRLLRMFAAHVLPRNPEASLTLVGDGPDHDAYEELAKSLGVADRVHFPGEHPVTEMARFYRNADLFVYASLSETYGQVVSEALWCGLPVVAFDDGMGVSHQLRSEDIGRLVTPGPDRADAERAFAAEVVRLLRDPQARRVLGERASALARRRSDPELCVARHYAAFLEAREHCARTWQPGPLASRAMSLARWTAFHGVVAGLGHLRQPAILNRHGRKQPNWEVEPSEHEAPPTVERASSIVMSGERQSERSTILPAAASAA